MLRKELPKMYELFDQIKNSSSSDAFSHVLDDFEENKSQELWILEEKKRELLKKEKQLQELDSDSWEFLKKEAFPYLTKKDELRGWTQLFDFLNQVPA